MSDITTQIAKFDQEIDQLRQDIEKQYELIATEQKIVQSMTCRAINLEYERRKCYCQSIVTKRTPYSGSHKQQCDKPRINNDTMYCKYHQKLQERKNEAQATVTATP